MRKPLLLVALTLAALASPAAARDALPPGFVYLGNIDPSIVQDMRYAGGDNFTGGRLPGYDAGECVLRRDVALALQKVQADLARQHLSLKTYDCYRP
ncbi:MAG TPA: M15 family metallopeptidase, partial [Pseudolabrys sp.]|nr:M15 family metallopeptidase [Pseudolabrys sp.]